MQMSNKEDGGFGHMYMDDYNKLLSFLYEYNGDLRILF